MDIFKNLWIERYRPTKLSDIVLTPETRTTFEKYRADGEIPNIAFIGSPGTGKTTSAKVIVNDLLGCQYQYINASDECGIDTIRTKVVGFAQTKSIDGKIKVIILDEMDGLSAEAQRGLRNTMEEYSSITRFILTGNYSYRITTPIQSRVLLFDLTPPLEGVIERCTSILIKEKIKFTPSDVEKIVRKMYPDMRKCIGALQRYSKTGVLVIPSVSEITEVVEQIWKLLKAKHVLKIRKWIIENETKFGGDYPNLLRTLFNYAYEQNIEDNLKKQVLIILSEYIWRSSQVLDQEINAYTCFLQLSGISV